MSLTASTMLPIREVSRVTGVNAVTLRAWERRYGLIKPHRTDKGHRLYTEANIQQIESILTWLNRGVAVGQVKALLQNPVELDQQQDCYWAALRHDLLAALQQFDPPQPTRQLHKVLAEHCAPEVCSQLLEPVFQALRLRWKGQFGSELETAFCHTWLRSALATWLAARNQRTDEQPLLLISLSDEHCEVGLWLLTLMLGAEGTPVNLLEWQVPASELTLMADQCNPRAIIFYGSQALPAHQLRRQLPKLLEHQACPVFMAGPAAAIHAGALSELGIVILPELPSLAYPLLLEELGSRA